MSTIDPSRLTAESALNRMETGDLTSRDLIRACLDRIDAREDVVRAWAYLDPELALAQADAADERRRAGTAGPLNGVPVGIKDIVDTADQPTENGSRLCAGRRPDKDATLVALLREAGAVIMGKCVTTEFALSAPGKTRNPHDPECTPGGSSSGSAAAVADWMVPLAIGSQTGGSMLRPASFNGVYGLKPTFGTISRAGMSPLSRRLDHPGIFARTPEDLALAARVLMRRDPADKDMRGHAKLGEAEPLDTPPRFAFVRGPAWSRGEADMQGAIEDMVRNLGDMATERNLPSVFETALECHGTIMHGSAAQSLGPYYERDRAGLDPITAERVERGLAVTARDFLDALYLAETMQDALAGFFEGFDAILTPAAPGQAPRDLSRTGDASFNGYWTLMGAPAASVPLLTGADGLPIGVQVICPWGQDARLLRVCRWLADRVGEWR
ncbi:MAG: amidase [Rhodospirillales bacterium CG15_BIG_FIL_POST_REV_8_21_14_020_66_15]|nr:MAG: amidase [Rhodospirillales bacterium CG15_BIG_FIL_POST_REV_8_21_14_020_66_15]